MSYLLEALGRGLLADLRSAFESQLPAPGKEGSEALRARLEVSPDSFDLAMRLGMACLSQVRLSEARDAFEKARQLRPVSAQPLVALACVNDELGHLDGAIKYLNAAQRRDSQDPAIVFGIGFCYERLDRTGEAKGAYRRAVDLCPQLRNAYERAAAIAIRECDWAEALSQYECLAEMEPGDLDVLLTLGGLYLKAERPAEAIEQYQRALLIEPDGSDRHLAAAEDLAEEGRLEEAIVKLEKLVHKYPGVAPFHVHLGDLHARAGHDDDALEHYQVALDTQPSFLEATVKLGTQHMRQGRYVDAAVTFNRAVELNDRLVTAFVGLGVAQHNCGRQQESLATFDLAASLEPSSTLLFSETARLHLKSEERQHGPGDDYIAVEPAEPLGEDDLLEEAVRRHRQAVLQSPHQADLHYRYGLLLRQVGQYEEAIEAFRKAVTINPSYSKALIKLAICLKECGETDEAIETFQRALALDGRYVDVHYQLGLLFAQRRQFDLAVEQFEQAVLGNDENIAFHANLALALQNIGMVDRAAATWRSICELSGVEDDVLAWREQVLRDANER